MTEVVSIGETPDAIARAMGMLRAGRVVVVPTDTIYGIAADAFNSAATAQIFSLKQRPRSLSLPVLVSRPRQAWALCAGVPAGATDLVAAFWPGPLTIVLPQSGELQWDLGDARASVALRMPAHDDLLALLEMTGPLAVTSANRTGERTPSTAKGVAEIFGDAVGIYLDGGAVKGEVASTIVDLSGAAPALVREGAIPATEIERVLGAPIARPAT